MAVRISGGFKKFEGGLKAGKPGGPKWWEDSAIVAFDADFGARIAGHGMSYDSGVEISSAQSYGAASTSFHSVTSSATGDIDFSRTDANTSPLTGDYTVRFFAYFPSGFASNTTIYEGYRAVDNSSDNRINLSFMDGGSQRHAAHLNNLSTKAFVKSVASGGHPTGSWVKINFLHRASDGAWFHLINGAGGAVDFSGAPSYSSPTEVFRMFGTDNEMYMDQYQIIPSLFWT